MARKTCGSSSIEKMIGFVIRLSVDRETNSKGRPPGDRIDLYPAAVLLDDAEHHFEPHAGALAYFLGGKKRIEDPGPYFFRYAWSVVDHADQDVVLDPLGFDGQVSLAGWFHGVQRVVDQVGPDLVELADEGLDGRQRQVEFFVHGNVALFYFISQHRQGIADPSVD